MPSFIVVRLIVVVNAIVVVEVDLEWLLFFSTACFSYGHPIVCL